MHCKILILFLSLLGIQGFSQVWIADNGDGTYNNPVLYADYSDPDVIRVGDDFFMTASSFTAVPGLPILHSKDLVNWKLINHAVRSEERRVGKEHRWQYTTVLVDGST